MMRDRVVNAFHSAHGTAPTIVVRSPGRVNLIGGHTDYNEGFVLPTAIDHATWLAAAPRNDRTVRIESLELGSATLDLDDLRARSDWTDYAAGTIWALGAPLARGFDVAVGTDVPVGAGLSSSAAIEIGIARVVTELSGVEWDPVAAAIAARRAENEFVGMPCGIMDQLIVATAAAGTASLIDCRSLAHTPAPIPDHIAVVILDTGTRRRLVDSAYENRRAACERVAAALGVPALRDADLDMVTSADIDPTDRRRALHIVTENARTQRAAAALHEADPATAGRLMDESHASLRDNYEVSGPALDAMVDVARSHTACLGARMTGAGFAGCAVALVQRDRLEDFISVVSAKYRDRTGNDPTLYPTGAAGGAAIV